MDNNNCYSQIQELCVKLGRLEIMSTGLVDQLDELEVLAGAQYLFQEEFNNLNSRNDFKLIENFISDLEVNAYVKDLENTLELVRKFHPVERFQLKNDNLGHGKVSRAHSAENCFDKDRI